ncbi:MAG: hypothetical protein ACO3JL_05525 [Myxococcota bacterium]
MRLCHPASVIVALVTTLLTAGPVTATPEATDRALDEAERLVVEGRRVAAIDAYRSLLSQGVDSAALRYNLGTLFLEEGELGHAVLHLETALLRDPRFEDARYNLEVARKLLVDHIDVPNQGVPSRSSTVSRWRTDELAWFSLLCLTLLAGAAAAWPWTSQHRRAKRLCSACVAVALVLTLSSTALLWGRLVDERTRRAVVLVREVEARVAPAPEAAPTFVAHAGLLGTIVAEEAGYVRLRLSNGLDAWLPQTAIGELGQR